MGSKSKRTGRSGNQRGPWHDVDPGRRAVMRANVRTGTSPERTMGRLLRKAGLRPAADAKGRGIRYRADFLLRRAKIAIFVDGCFWHGCPQHWTKSKTRSDYWLEKRRANRLRDARANKAYVDAGWVVYRIWEHDAELFGGLVDAVKTKMRQMCDKGSQ